MTLQRTFRARTEDTPILGRSQPWAYGNNKFRRSLTIEFHPSGRCNFSCMHCQGRPYRDAWGRRAPQMRPDFVRRFFSAYDGRKDLSVGMWRVIVSGMTGEPTMNPEATRLIMRGAKERNVALGLSTNGMLLKADDIGILASENTPNDWLNLSADSPLGDSPRLGRIYQRAHGCGKQDGLSVFMRRLEQAAEMKCRKGSTLQINVDWIISDLSLDSNHIMEDLVGTISYLNSIPGVSLLRLQLPFYLHGQVPGLSDANNAELAAALEDIRVGRAAFSGLRKDFLVKLRNNWHRRIQKLSECSAARDYGVVFGPDGKAYFCPYAAAPGFEKPKSGLPQITVENLWEKVCGINPLRIIDAARCQATCALKNCFVEPGIVR